MKTGWLKSIFAVAIICTGGSLLWGANAPLETTNPPTLSVKVLLPHTPLALRCYVVDSHRAGPTVLIINNEAQDEIAGALAADSFRDWPVCAGNLVIIPCINTPNLVNQAARVLKTQVDVQSNSAGGNSEAALSQALFELVKNIKPEYWLAITSNTNHPPAPATFSATIAAQANLPVLNLTFSRGNSLSNQIVQIQLAVKESLKKIGLLNEDFAASAPDLSRITNLLSWPRIVAAIYRGPGTGGKGPPNLLRQINANPETCLSEISPEEVSQGRLTNFDAVIFAGGSASRQSAALDETGREQVRRFVGAGGGYIGVCAGAYLACCGSDQRLQLINAAPLSTKWQRGRAVLDVELTQTGFAVIGGSRQNIKVMYHNGPVVGPAKITNLPPYETLAWFRSETAQHDTPKGIMVNSPAIFTSNFKTGRVVCVSPHPEQSDGLDFVIPRLLELAANQQK